MPMFSFICQDCGSQFEEWVRSTSAVSEVNCPSCESEQVNRQLSRVARMQPVGGTTTYSSAASSANCSPGGL